MSANNDLPIVYMRCDGCNRIVDVELDPMSLAIGENECVCKRCRQVYYYYESEAQDEHAA